MKAKELRIGNHVDLYGSIAQITRFDFNEIPPKGIAVDKGKPIPLTEEWLIKSKAKKVANTYHSDRFLLIWKPEYKYWYVLDLDSLTYLTKIEFVHEWQNFYFIMQGVELRFE